MPIDSIIQAAFVAIAVIVILLFLVFSMLLEGTLKKKKLIPSDEEEVSLPDSSDFQSSSVELAPSEEPEPELTPIYEKYPEIYRFEILYWQGVSKPWWWNNYAKDLVDYAGEYFPWNKVDFYSSFNSNSKTIDSVDLQYHDRIMALRPHKRSKHALVVINYDQEYIMIDSSYALEAMKDRIDAEWYRQYRFKKTYRNSPIYITK